MFIMFKTLKTVVRYKEKLRLKKKKKGSEKRKAKKFYEQNLSDKFSYAVVIFSFCLSSSFSNVRSFHLILHPSIRFSCTVSQKKKKKISSIICKCNSFFFSPSLFSNVHLPYFFLNTLNNTSVLTAVKLKKRKIQEAKKKEQLRKPSKTLTICFLFHHLFFFSFLL